MKFSEIEILEGIYEHDPNYFNQIDLKDLIRSIDSIQEDRNPETKHHLVNQALDIFKKYLQQLEKKGIDKSTFPVSIKLQEIIEFIEKQITQTREEIIKLDVSKTLISPNQDQIPVVDYTELEESLDEALESLGDEIYNSIDFDQEIEEFDYTLESEFQDLSFDQDNIEESLENTLYTKERQGIIENQTPESTLDRGGNCIENYNTQEFDFEILKDSHNLKILESLFYISMGFDRRKSLFYNYLLSKIFYKIQLFNFPDKLTLKLDDFKINNPELNPQEQMVQILIHKLFKHEIPENLEKEAQFVESMIYLRNTSLNEFNFCFNYFFNQIFEMEISKNTIIIHKINNSKQLTCFGIDFNTISETKELYEFVHKFKSINKDYHKIMLLNLLRDGFVNEEIDRLIFIMQELGLEDVEFLNAKIFPSRSILTINPN